MSKFLVVEVNRYDFEDQKTGRQIRGVKVKFIDPKSPIKENHMGNPVQAVTLQDLNRYNNYTAVPGIYEMNFEIVPGPGDKPAILCESEKLIKAVKFTLE